MFSWLAVFIGGGLGSLCRYMLTLFIASDNFPVATLLANVIACGILGFLSAYWVKADVSQEVRLLFVTGFCGGFSTFSTFSKELLDVGQSEQMQALVYLITSLVLGILAVYIGLQIGSAKN